MYNDDEEEFNSDLESLSDSKDSQIEFIDCEFPDPMSLFEEV